MSPEILDYNEEKLSHWDWLTRFGKPVWNTRAFDKIVREDRQLEAFNDLKNLIGQPSLEAWRYFLTRFNSDFPGITTTLCVFYFYDRDPKSTEGTKRESRVFFPLEVAINPSLLSRDWINQQREILAQKWSLRPVSFGITGNVYGPTEWEWVRSSRPEKGELGEHWAHDERLFSPRHFERERFMVFGDIDEKTSDKQFMSASKQLGTPFLIADTSRGHHILFPLLFGGGGWDVRDAEILVTGRLKLILDIDFENRHLARSGGNYEYAIRVTSGLRREETPTISALVWDGNTIVREPASKSA